MNIRKIKLALTIDLLNSSDQDNPLRSARSVMKKYRDEAGNYQGTSVTNRTIINENLEKSTHAIKFDHCTLDINLISDKRATRSLIQGFDLHENLS